MEKLGTGQIDKNIDEERMYETKEKKKIIKESKNNMNEKPK